MTCWSDCGFCQTPTRCNQSTVPAFACVSAGAGSTTCPGGCQDKIDRMYHDCADCRVCFNETCFNGTSLSFNGPTWETTKKHIKAAVEAAGCNGADQADPAIFVAIAAVIGHFLN